MLVNRAHFVEHPEFGKEDKKRLATLLEFLTSPYTGNIAVDSIAVRTCSFGKVVVVSYYQFSNALEEKEYNENGTMRERVS
jgi:hypothetical protein